MTTGTDPVGVINGLLGESDDIGITKREYFAALALQGFLSGRGYADYNDAAEWAVSAADALIAELNA